MTSKELAIELARQVGAVVEVGLAPVFYDHAQLHRFYQLVRNEALEEAAKYCEDQSIPPHPLELQTDVQWAAKVMAIQIRCRKEPSN